MKLRKRPLTLKGHTVTIRQRLGALLLIAVILIVIAYEFWPKDDLTIVRGYGGVLKRNFLSDPRVAKILKDRYGLKVDITTMGSIELACGIEFKPDDDFVWLGDLVALERYRARGCPMARAESIYNSPIVLYSWAPIVDALVAAGVARNEGGDAYSVDFALLVEMIEQGRTWADIGLPDLHGRISVHTTDPAKSNSGFLFAGMLANTLNGGSVANPTTVDRWLPNVQRYFLRFGYMAPTSGELFDQFVITGMGSRPIVALYESQGIEHVQTNPNSGTQVSQQVRILYPRPTVWAAHPFVARTETGARLLDALKDPAIQQLAWDEHGQRPSVLNVAINPSAMPIPGFLLQIPSATNMPAPAVMDQILVAIATPPVIATTEPLPSPPAAAVRATPPG